ncbi:MAG: hypothetical protein U9R24_07260 [Thermodesulfobacteriota bacterium]|nr:hypothetical protein [Thermodesulfobacteriota bacterium]
MANLHKELGTYHEKIALSPGKKDSLRKSRNAIRERIRKHFGEKLGFEVPKFYGQGSFAMVTTVNPLDGEFDIDDGVYLQHLDEADNSEWPTSETIHRWLVDATDGQTNEKPIDKRTCVRVRYAGLYHVDLPSYASLNGKFMLAEKGDKGWHHSDSKALTEWFNEQVQLYGENKQLRRVVRYLKAWADYQSLSRGKMPSGLILTVLAAQNFRPHERDDRALVDTAAAMSVAVNPAFCVLNPVDNAEELTSRLSEIQKERFQDAISDLASDGIDAINCISRKQASEIWQKQLGDRFPFVDGDDVKDEKVQKEKASALLAAAYIGKNPPKPWAGK